MANQYERYQRQIILPGMGIPGQNKLFESKILVVGAGGLGCPALLYLASAGVGNLGIIDDDLVSVNNLHRQVLFGDEHVGLPKAITGQEILSKQNSQVKIQAYQQRLSKENVFELIALYDYVLDCTDNFPTRYLLNDACTCSKKTLVFGAISQYEGQVAIFNSSLSQDGISTNYRDLFPEMPASSEVRNCAEEGVINVLAGITGTMMAAETIKLVTSIGTPLVDRLCCFNMLSNEQYIVKIVSSAGTRYTIPASKDELLKRDYEDICIPGTSITKDKLNELMNSQDILIVDVRERGELPEITSVENINVPLSDLENHFEKFTKDIIVLFCQTGMRSEKARMVLNRKFGNTKTFYSLGSGVASLQVMGHK